MIILPRGTVSPDEAVPWIDALATSYQLLDKLEPDDALKEFVSCFSLLPVIRRLRRKVNNDPHNSNSLFLLCSILTDRGLLAEQTRDLFSDQSNQSRLATKLSYMPVVSPSDCHDQSKKKALRENSSLWKHYFPHHDMDIIFSTLLDALNEKCSHTHKTVSQVLFFPDINDLDCALRKDDNIFPDEYETTYADHVGIRFNGTYKQPAMVFFQDLCQKAKLQITSEALVFFINYPLKTYFTESRTLYSIPHGKQYHSVIARRDIERLAKQAQDCRIMFAGLLTAIALKQTKRRSTKTEPPTSLNGLKQILQKYCQKHPTDTDSEDLSDEDQYICDCFVNVLKKNWGRLSGNPYLIYKIWTSKSRVPFAEENQRLSLYKWVEQACKLPQIPDLVSNAKNSENYKFYKQLLKLFCPEDEEHFLQRCFLDLFDAVESINDTQSPDFLSWIEAHVEKNLQDCLAIAPECLVEYPAGMTDQDVLKTWLDNEPVIISQLKNIFLQDSNSQETAMLRRHFRQAFETPNEQKLASWETILKKTIAEIQWNTLAPSRPPLVSHSKAAIGDFHRFLVAWTLLQMEIEDAKQNLRKIIQIVLSDFRSNLRKG